MTALRADAADFRKTREARFGKPLEEVVAGREKSVEGFRRTLEPMRLTLKTQAYLGGNAPNYADYIVFGAFQWARVVSPFKCWPRTIRSMRGAKNCWTRSTAWRANRRDIRCRSRPCGRCVRCRVPDAVQRTWRCTAEPGPTRSVEVGPGSAARRFALRSIRERRGWL